jgi:glycosyltransferase involved in cell wall biosynthesis
MRPLIAGAIVDRRPLVFSPPPQLSRRALAWARWIARRRDVQMICSSGAQSKRFSSGEDCHGIPLALPNPAPVVADAATLRRRLGLAPDDFVVLTLGESTPQARHELALWTVAIVHELDERWKLLSWGRGAQAPKLHRLSLQLHRPRLLCLGIDFEFDQLLPAADAAVVTAGEFSATLPAAMCMAAGIPMVEFEPQAPRAGAQKLLDLSSDPRLRQTLGESARNQAAKFLDFDRFVEQHRQVYATRPGF